MVARHRDGSEVGSTAVLETERVPHVSELLLRGAGVERHGHGLAVDLDRAVFDAHAITRERDDALQEDDAVFGRREDDDIATRRPVALDDIDVGERHAHAVRDLVDQDAVSHVHRRRHGAARDDVVIRQRRARREDHSGGDRHGDDVTREWATGG